MAQRLLGARRVHAHVVREHARIEPGERVLDIGCGPGDVLAVLPGVDYLGIDPSPDYIAAARRRHEGARFVLAGAGHADLAGEAPFDAALALGVLHHLDDAEANGLFALAARAVAADGRLVALDPGRRAGQHGVARWLAARDRGGHVRTPEQYRALAEAHFDAVVVTTHDRLARVPYTHAVLECRSPRRDGPDPP